MRIALLQLNSNLADPELNGRVIEDAYQKAISLGAELCLTPEMALPGYLAEDRLWESGLRRRIEAESQRLARVSTEVPIVFGTCSASPSGRLWNELWWCAGGRPQAVARKRILATYDVFDEERYFDADTDAQPLIDFKGERVGMSICEDLWAGAAITPGLVRYDVDPIADLAERGATLILNASASPAHLGTWVPEGRTPAWILPSKQAMRRQVLEGHARRHGIPIAYANRAGSESWLIFDGGSGLVRSDGRWSGTEYFQETILIVDTMEDGQAWPSEMPEALWLQRALGLGLKENLGKQGLEAVVVGLSGGIDSAVVAAIAAEHLGSSRVLGVSLPTCYTSQESLDLAKNQADILGIPFLTVSAEAPFSASATALHAVFPDRSFGLTDENLQSRARGTLLMALTTEPHVHALLGTQRVAVLNTGNKSEAATGYFTLYGDGIGAFGILGDCLKQRVYALARACGDAIPAGVLHRKPTAELAPGQSDETSLLPYGILDSLLAAFVETRQPLEKLSDDLADVLEGVDLDTARAAIPRVIALIRNSEFKRRQLPFSLKVSPRAFGRGRRIPLTGV